MKVTKGMTIPSSIVRQPVLCMENEKILAVVDGAMQKLKIGSRWKGRGKNQVATVESIDGATIRYRNKKGSIGHMTADYFVYWYRPLLEK